MRDKKRFLTVLLSIMCMLSLILTSFSITAVSSADDISGDDGTVEGTDDEDEEDEEDGDDEDADDDLGGIDTVMNFVASKIEKKAVTLKWDKVSDIDGYTVEYKAASASKWSDKAVAAAKNSVKITGLKIGTRYNFRIRAYIHYEEDLDDEEDEEEEEEEEFIDDIIEEDEEDEEEDEGEEDFPEYEYGEYSKMTLTTLKKDGSGVKKAVSNTYEKKATGVKTSKLRSLKSTKKGTVELSWKKNAKATGYEIYMSNKKSSGYKKVATIKNNNTVKYIKKKLKSGEKFFFKIRAYVVKKKVKTFTKYSAVKSITVK